MCVIFTELEPSGKKLLIYILGWIKIIQYLFGVTVWRDENLIERWVVKKI